MNYTTAETLRPRQGISHTHPFLITYVNIEILKQQGPVHQALVLALHLA